MKKKYPKILTLFQQCSPILNEFTHNPQLDPALENADTVHHNAGEETSQVGVGESKNSAAKSRRRHPPSRLLQQQKQLS